MREGWKLIAKRTLLRALRKCKAEDDKKSEVDGNDSLPCVAPLNLPSVTKATLLPRFAPIRAALGPSISGIPGL